MVDVPRPQTNDIWPIWVESGRVGGMTSYRFLASAKGLCVYMTRHTHKIQRALRNACSMQTGAKIALVLACDCHCSAERQETAVKPPQTTYIAWRVLSIFQYCLDNAREPHFPPPSERYCRRSPFCNARLDGNTEACVKPPRAPGAGPIARRHCRRRPWPPPGFGFKKGYNLWGRFASIFLHYTNRQGPLGPYSSPCSDLATKIEH